MRTWIILFTLGSASLFGGAYCIQRDVVVVEADYWAVWRQHIKKLTMVTPNASSFARIDMPYESGLRIRAEFLPMWWGSFEFRFEGMLKWNKHKTLVNTAGMAVPTNPYVTNDWSGFEELEYHYRSKFDSYEFSWLQHLTPRQVDYFSFAVIAGIRAIDFRDRILLTNERSDFSINCKNWSIGGQAGMDFEGNPESYFTWKIDTRVGMYANMIRKNISLGDDGNTIQAANKKRKRTQVAYTVEITPSIIWQPGSIFFTFGAEYFGLYNVAIAPSQLSFGKDLNKIYAKKNLILKTLFVGGGYAF